MTTTTGSPEPAPKLVEDTSLGTASLVLGILGFFPIPGMIASVLAVAVGLTARLSDSASTRTKQRATLGICLGVASVAIFGVFCFVYFTLLGYPLPHIHRYHAAP